MLLREPAGPRRCFILPPGKTPCPSSAALTRAAGKSDVRIF